MKLELYYFDACPYCQRVMNYIKETNRKDIVYKDIHADKEAYQTLLEKGGMDQVPCLMIDDKALYESLDIIEWLKNNPE